jgi:hypothetical protein
MGVIDNMKYISLVLLVLSGCATVPPSNAQVCKQICSGGYVEFFKDESQECKCVLRHLPYEAKKR